MVSNNIYSIAKMDCCGCASCYNICSHNAIKMISDEQGFVYPQIDESKCVNCGLCIKACPIPSLTNLKPLNCYAMKKVDYVERLSSSSGGVASAIAEDVISRGGAAYGVTLNSKGDVKTERAITIEGIEKFKGSKYVQSFMGYSFSECQKDLRDGKSVAFFATSCHIDGLLHYLKAKNVDTTRLLTIDLICHGVPSPKVFKDYISFLNKRKPVEGYEFRTKKNGWGNGSAQFAPLIRYKDGTEECSTLRCKAWLDLFFSNCCLRPRCYNCSYAGKGRCADITIADYWGLQNIHPEFYDDGGVSLVISNTEKGDHNLRNLKEIEMIPSDYSAAIIKQNNAHSPSRKSVRYDKFWEDYKRYQMDFILRHYTGFNYKRRLLVLLFGFFNKGGGNS